MVDVHVTALDFDGVIAESAREAYVVASRTYLAQRPESWLASAGVGAAAADPALHGFAEDELFAAFCALMPFGNRAEDYGVSLVLLEERADVSGQDDYDARFAAQRPAFLREYHRQFYVERERLMNEDPETWRDLQPPYEPVVAALRRRGAAGALAIATAKDRRSTWALLAAYGVADLFIDRLVLDKEAGASKRAHIGALQSRLGCSADAITFVDDKLRHLDDVAALGVRCALAGWGYNSARERAVATTRGYAVLTFATFEATLAGETEVTNATA